MIAKTLISSNLSYLYSWEDYLTTQLPVEWQPNAPYLIAEIANNLKASTRSPQRSPSTRRTGIT